MSILCTFPGRAGDLFWALPTIRALARRTKEAIDLQICGEFGGLVPLLQQQPYLGRVRANLDWGMSEGWRPPTIEGISPQTLVFHLGYERWPELALPFETLHTFNGYKQDLLDPLLESELDLQTPWIQVLGPYPPTEIAVGFSECHFELKVGLVTLLEATRLPALMVLTHNKETRWARERPIGGYPLHSGPWLEEAGIIRDSSVFLGCNSGLHVLAVALGIPVVLMEPMEARWNPIFFPLGTTGPQVTLVMGNDGKPTFDARAVADTLLRVLSTVRTVRTPRGE